MNTITNIIGQRLRVYRQKRGLTQEEMAEKADLHATYIGQVERGEKNLTLVSLEKMLAALDVSFSEFFKHIETVVDESNPAAQCYELINSKKKREQEQFYRILCEIDALMK